ncbi:MAG: hypothetical protein QOJ97_2393 [Solirubrobacteraceae bacterium]|jgi:hypothetical protein|nr:hypothetical protein [Solirubrobacteraceae bacterium]
MNLWVLGWSTGRAPDPRRARDAVADALDPLPFLKDVPVRGWQAPSGTAVAAWAADAGPAHVEAAQTRLALWSGRPIRWEAGGRADGRGPLDAALYEQPSHRWAQDLDGRCAAVAYDDSEPGLTVYADPLGAYPLYRTEAHGATWLSNRAEPLRALAASRSVDLDALAGLLGGGWPLGGQPAWSAVRRVAPGVLSLHPQAGERRRELLAPADSAALCGAGWDAATAAGLLVEEVRALADWPGRASLVPVTGGRDSRLIRAAARRAGISFTAATGGAPNAPDVVGAAALCQAAGIEHELLPADPAGDPWSAPAEAARVLGLTASGTASLGDAAGFPLSAGAGPGALWHSGQGGELARRYYAGASARDRDGAVDALERVFCGRRPGRSEPLSPAGRARVREGLAAWVDGRLATGARVEDLPDLFYLDERMGAWAGPTHGAVEWVRDTTSPLWSTRLLPHMLGPSVEEREGEAFHDAVLRELAPELAAVPYAGASKRGLGHKVRRAAEEARRRVARPAPPAAGAPDPFAAVLQATRQAVWAQPQHAAWHVLDRERSVALLDREAGALDEMSRAYVWRIATVFLDPAMAEGTA